MNYALLWTMHEELSLLCGILIIFILDLFVSKNEISPSRKPILLWTTIVVVLLHTIFCTFTLPTVVSSGFSGMYLSYPIASVLKIILNIGAIFTLLVSTRWLTTPSCYLKQGEFCFLLLVTLLGMYFMVSSGHFIVFFIGLEMASIPMVALIMLDKQRRNSAEAGAKFMLMSMFSTALMLYGISLLYGTMGTLYFEQMQDILSIDSYLPLLALAFIVGGIGFKIALVPFHNWSPDTYQGAPAPITAYLSTVSKGAAIFTLFIMLWHCFGETSTSWDNVAFWLIAFTITVGNLFALRQENLKRLMAYSSIAQAGYILLATLGVSFIGIESLVYYVLAYLMANFVIFSVLHLAEEQGYSTDIKYFDGLAKRHSYIALAMTLALLSLAGIPPLAGFFSKFFVFMAAFKVGQVGSVFVALLNTILSLYYYLWVVKVLYIHQPTEKTLTLSANLPTKTILVIAIIGIIFIGLCSPIYEFIHHLNSNSFM